MNEQLVALEKAWHLSTTKGAHESQDKLLIYLKLGRSFLSQLALLQFPANLFSVLIVSSKLLPKLSKEQMQTFACVLQVDKGKAAKNWRDLSDVHYDEVAQLVAAACRLAPFEGGKQLITLEEPLVRICAHLRTLHGFGGLQEDRVGLFVDKLAIKNHCDKRGIKAAFSMPFTVKEKSCSSVDQFADDVAASLGFPLYVKPQHGCASVGHQMLRTHDELHQWLLSRWNLPEPYLIEERIIGDEFTIYMFVQGDKILHSRTFHNEYPVGSFVMERLPICKLEVLASHVHYNMLSSFANRVVDAWKPIPDGIFFIQFFLNAEKEECTLIELCCRLPGGKYPAALLRATSIDLEEMHLLANVQSVGFSDSGPFMAFLRYPRKAGRVSSLQAPDSLDIKSCCLARWRIAVGDVLENPRGVAGRHEAVSIILLNNDYDELMRDYYTLISRYNPFSLEETN
uniref:ATP-grasp domain-containing protein n=1 Tax=Trichuris muris TaxID=70415 RepID=A0A5S6Q245_TRIMR